MTDTPLDTHSAEPSSTLIALRPKRADGRRNYDAILAAARAAFFADGADASLQDIAATAGVAIGTLYRHFPSRASLVEAATREGLAALTRSVSEVDNPMQALTYWMQQVIKHFSTFRGLVGILAESMYDEGTPTYAACAAMHACGARLLAAAQQAGYLRADLTPNELFDILSAAAWLRERSDDEQSDRMLDLILGGLEVR